MKVGFALGVIVLGGVGATEEGPAVGGLVGGVTGSEEGFFVGSKVGIAEGFRLGGLDGRFVRV